MAWRFVKAQHVSTVSVAHTRLMDVSDRLVDTRVRQQAYGRAIEHRSIQRPNPPSLLRETPTLNLKPGSPDLLSDPTTALLALKPGVLKGSYVYFVALELISSADSSAVSSVTMSLTINGVPFGGACSVSPTSGVALQTQFTFACSGWMTENENLPLSYAFQLYDPVTKTPKSMLRSFDSTSSFTTTLPGGSPVTIQAQIVDRFGASSVTYLTASVSTPDVSSPSALTAATSEALNGLFMAMQSGDLNAAGSYILGISSLLRTAASSDQSAAAVEQRTALRGQMLGALVNLLNTSGPISASRALQSSDLVASVVGAPAEVSGNMSASASSLGPTLTTSLIASSPDTPLPGKFMTSVLGISSSLLDPKASSQCTFAQSASVVRWCGHAIANCCERGRNILPSGMTQLSTRAAYVFRCVDTGIWNR
jgi:hypothetical protein